uniref:Uncharacterized protein n=1 Tax=Anguilla anguilla TaxID=7936 RepID=A0A0E9Q9K5_ANGAN
MNSPGEISGESQHVFSGVGGGRARMAHVIWMM